MQRADHGFVLRTPLLPLDTLTAWAADPDPRAFLAELVARPDVREAIYVATPALAEGIERWRRDPNASSSVELALARYLARMTARATPFGLFSGVSTARIGGETSLHLARRELYRRRTRLDNDYLFALAELLQAEPAIRARLRFRPNSSLYELAGRVRYAEARLEGTNRSYHLVDVEATPYLSATLRRSAHGATLEALAAALVADDPEISSDEAVAFVDELAATQLLVPELGVAVTGGEPLARSRAVLDDAGADSTARCLAAVERALDAIDERGLGNPPDAYIAIERELAALPAEVERSRLFQVDMVKPAEATLDPRTAAAVARAIEWLRQIARPREETALDRFRKAFVERYERRAVPLAEALDHENGIGFDADALPSARGGPLLAGLGFPPRRTEPERRAWGRFERHMLRRLSTAIAARAGEIVLDDADRAAMANPDARQLPDAYHAIVRLGRSAVLLLGSGGPSGARLLGRFCHAAPEIEAMVRAHLRAEEARRPDAVFAEIVHLPAGRLGNILCRPVLRDHELVYLGVSGAPVENQITIDDLLVSVRDERVALTSRRLGREVVPRLTTAHNTASGLATYRFLCALQDDAGAAWWWGALDDAPFLPRVRIGDVTVARATWNLAAADLANLSDVAALRDRLRLPRFVAIAVGDNELPIDLDNPMLARVFVDELGGKRAARLVELFPAPGQSCVRGPEGEFANEAVLLFSTDGPAASAPRPVRLAQAQRSFEPGSRWLYAKLYTGWATIDRVLRDAIAPVVRDAIERGDASHWYFIRDADPLPHLRVRFAGEPERLVGSVLPALARAVEPLRDAGVIAKLQLETYQREIERFGGDAGIEACERLFWIDSEAALAIVERLEGDAGGEARWRLALRGAESLLATLGFSADDRHRIFANAREGLAREHGVDAAFFAPIGERYKRERRELEQIFAGEPVAGLADELAILAARDVRLEPISRELRERDAAGALDPALGSFAWSLVHMHVNRLLHASLRAQELVLSDLLRRLHEARRARARGSR